MADLPYIQQRQEVSITGQDSVGDQVNYVGADTNGNLFATLPDRTNLTQNITALNQTVAVNTANMGSVVIQVTGTWSATLTFQATIDGVNWFSWFGLSNSQVTNVGSITSNDQVSFNAGGIQQFRVNCTAYTSGTAVVSVVASQSFGGIITSQSTLSGGNIAVAIAASPATVPVSIQNASNFINSYASVAQDANNTSTTNLGSGASFTGTTTNIVNNQEGTDTIAIILDCNQNCTVQIQQTTNNPATSFDLIDSYTTTGGTTDGRLVKLVGTGYRVVITNNGASTSTTFHLSTMRLQGQSVLPRTLSQAGNLKVAVQEALPAGSNTIGAVTQASGPWTQNLTQFGGTNLSTGTGASGTGIPRVTVSNDSEVQIWDGTNRMAVKAASTAALATDPSAVVALSPNSPVPAGTNSIGAVTQATASNFNAQVVGNIASLAADSGNPVKTGGVYNSGANGVAPTNGQRVDHQSDTTGALYVNPEVRKATYSSAIAGLTLAATATDIFTISGSSTKTIRINRVSLTMTTTSGSGAGVNISLIKRSALDTGGTSTTQTNTPHDSSNAAGTAVVKAFTANPTALGATTGTMRALRYAIAASNTIDLISWDFATRPSQAIVLRGVNDNLAVNLGSTTVTGGVACIDIEWTEE